MYKETVDPLLDLRFLCAHYATCLSRRFYGYTGRKRSIEVAADDKSKYRPTQAGSATSAWRHSRQAFGHEPWQRRRATTQAQSRPPMGHGWSFLKAHDVTRRRTCCKSYAISIHCFGKCVFELPQHHESIQPASVTVSVYPCFDFATVRVCNVYFGTLWNTVRKFTNTFAMFISLATHNHD